MAIRQIRVAGDPILNKVCKEVKDLTPKMQTLIEDMLDTMYEANGVGLAAPQVGILRRIAVVDIGDGPIVLVNPQIIEEDGEQTGDEACLSLPGKAGEVKRTSQNYHYFSLFVIHDCIMDIANYMFHVHVTVQMLNFMT